MNQILRQRGLVLFYNNIKYLQLKRHPNRMKTRQTNKNSLKILHYHAFSTHSLHKIVQTVVCVDRFKLNSNNKRRRRSRQVESKHKMKQSFRYKKIRKWQTLANRLRVTTKNREQNIKVHRFNKKQQNSHKQEVQTTRPFSLYQYKELWNKLSPAPMYRLLLF